MEFFEKYKTKHSPRQKPAWKIGAWFKSGKIVSGETSILFYSILILKSCLMFPLCWEERVGTWWVLTSVHNWKVFAFIMGTMIQGPWRTEEHEMFTRGWGPCGRSGK